MGTTGVDKFMVDVHAAGDEVDDRDDDPEDSMLDSFGVDE